MSYIDAIRILFTDDEKRKQFLRQLDPTLMPFLCLPFPVLLHMAVKNIMKDKDKTKLMSNMLKKCSKCDHSDWVVIED